MNFFARLYYRLRKWTKAIQLYLVIAGPGLVVMIADNDAGGITTYAATGAARLFAQARSTAGLALGLPFVMAIPALPAIVRDFEADAVRVGEESGPIVGSILGVELCFRCPDARCTKLVCNGSNIVDGLDAKAKMVKPGSIGIVLSGTARRTENVAEMTVEVLDVWVATQDKFVLPEAKHLEQYPIVETLGAMKIRNCDVDVVDACNFSHGAEM